MKISKAVGKECFCEKPRAEVLVKCGLTIEDGTSLFLWIEDANNFA